MRPCIFVRELSEVERKSLSAGLRSPDAFVLRRSQILLASARGEHVPLIARSLCCDEQTVRHAIHAFNQQGCSSLQAGSSRPHHLPTVLREDVTASWHSSKIVRTWIREHNQQVKTASKGVRILPLFLPKQSPWLNPIEPKWVHGKRAVVEPSGLLSAQQPAERICAYYHCSYEAHLSVPEKVS